MSERTLYRDVNALRAGGALIDGAAGVGYTLTEDPALPPQMVTRQEVEALILGLAEVGLAAHPALPKAAEAAQAKIIANLPDRVQRQAIHAVSRTLATPYYQLASSSLGRKRAELSYRDLPG